VRKTLEYVNYRPGDEDIRRGERNLARNKKQKLALNQEVKWIEEIYQV
jgi:hypothetical protein